MAHGFLTSPPVQGTPRREIFISAVQYGDRLRSGNMSVLELTPSSLLDLENDILQLLGP